MNENTISDFIQSVKEYFSKPPKNANDELKRLQISVTKEEIDKEINELTAKETGFDRIKELLKYE